MGANAARTARGFLRRDVASQRQKDGCTAISLSIMGVAVLAG